MPLCISQITIIFVGHMGGEVGLAITQLIGLVGIFQWGMKQSAELENQMTSVERVLEFMQVEHEPPLESVSVFVLVAMLYLCLLQAPGEAPPPDWPQKGRIEFEKVYMTYSINEPPVLKNLNFVILPKEKVLF